MLVRDELANLAWAVERRLESPLEVGLETAKDVLDLAPPPDEPREVPLYRLASPVPAHWIPLIPVQVAPGSAEVRLARGAVLDLDGAAAPGPVAGAAPRRRRRPAADPRGGGPARGRRRPPQLPGRPLARRPPLRLGRQPRLRRPRRSLERPRLRRAGRLILRALTIYASYAVANSHHREMVDALGAGDEAAVAQALRADIESAYRSLMPQLGA